MRMITYSRPGYGASSPYPVPGGARVRDDVADAVTVLDELGADEFLTLGWSGGGPRALACAALIPERCRAAASLAGVAPYDADGLDWPAGMGQENVDDRSEEHTSELQSRQYLVCRLLLEKKNTD